MAWCTVEYWWRCNLEIAIPQNAPLLILDLFLPSGVLACQQRHLLLFPGHTSDALDIPSKAPGAVTISQEEYKAIGKIAFHRAAVSRRHPCMLLVSVPHETLYRIISNRRCLSPPRLCSFCHQNTAMRCLDSCASRKHYRVICRSYASLNFVGSLMGLAYFVLESRFIGSNRAF